MAQRLHTAIDASQTTIVLRDTIDQVSMGQAGVILVGSERIRYTGTTDRELLGCTRGYAGTTAATHTEGSLVTVEGSDSGASTSTDFVGISETYAKAGSHQPISADLTLTAGAGSTGSGGDTDYLAAVMGNVLGADMATAQDANYLAGVIGAFSITGTKRTTYPAGGVLGQITDGVTEADGAVVAYVDGDSAVTKANAAFKAMCNNSTAGSGFNYGLDFYSPSHDGFLTLAILKADIRMTNEVCMLNGSGAPVDGVSGTGAGFAGPGSMYTRTSNGELYLNTNTKASPAWKIVTHA